MEGERGRIKLGKQGRGFRHPHPITKSLLSRKGYVRRGYVEESIAETGADTNSG